MELIENKLFELRDRDYAEFNKKIIKSRRDPIIGVRTPLLREMATWVRKNGYTDEFLSELPHKYFEENNLHAFIISDIKNYDDCLKKVIVFLPFVNNWATCDQMSPKIFAHKRELIEDIKKWLCSDKTFTIRFGILMLMKHFSDELFKNEYLDYVASIDNDNYYVKMMAAWYFATLLAKQYDAAMPYLIENRLKKWIHNKTIQKALDSYRISPQKKELLRRLRLK